MNVIGHQTVAHACCDSEETAADRDRYAGFTAVATMLYSPGTLGVSVLFKRVTSRPKRLHSGLANSAGHIMCKRQYPKFLLDMLSNVYKITLHKGAVSCPIPQVSDESLGKIAASLTAKAAPQRCPVGIGHRREDVFQNRRFAFLRAVPCSARTRALVRSVGFSWFRAELNHSVTYILLKKGECLWQQKELRILQPLAWQASA